MANVVLPSGDRLGPNQMSNDPQFRAALANGDRVFFKLTRDFSHSKSIVWFEVVQRGEELRYIAQESEPEI